MHFDGLLWLLLLLGPLLFLQRSLHREIQSVFLLITRRNDVALVLFSLLFLPGVLLHETSHYLVARLLGVSTGRFSLLPKATKDGRLQLGFVETTTTDVLRDALIGAAPLLGGGLFVTYAGLVRLNLGALWEGLVSGNAQMFWKALRLLPQQPDFWVWFYLTFAVSSTMLPSASDRRAWQSLALMLLGLLALVLVAGAGPWLLGHLAPLLNQALRALAVVLGISVLVHAVMWFPFFLGRRLLVRLTGFQVTDS